MADNLGGCFRKGVLVLMFKMVYFSVCLVSELSFIFYCQVFRGGKMDPMGFEQQLHVFRRAKIIIGGSKLLSTKNYNLSPKIQEKNISEYFW